MTQYRDIFVEPREGKVFVSGDDSVWVFDHDGSLITTIPDIFGAGGIDSAGDRLYVAMTSAGKIAEIDLSTLVVSRTIALGGPITGFSLAVINGFAWFADSAALRRLNLTTGVVSTRGDVLGEGFEKIPGSPTTLLTYSTWGPMPIRKVDIAAFPATVNTTDQLFASAPMLAVSPAGDAFIGPRHNDQFAGIGGEIALDSMKWKGISSTLAFPQALAYSPGFGGLLATSEGFALHVSRKGEPVAAVEFRLPHDQVPRGMAVSLDGTRAYSLGSVGSFWSGTRSLVTVDTRPVLGSISPQSVVAGVPSELTLTGRGLGGTATATVGGLRADVIAVSDNEVRVVVPTSLAVGRRTVQVSVATGTVSGSVQLTTSTGAVLNGTVSARGSALSGVELTLREGPLSSPRVAVSSTSGAYSLVGLPYGVGYQLTAHDPTGVFPDRVITGIALAPNQATITDVELSSSQVGPGAEIGSSPLPASPRGILREPTTDRTFVSSGDQVLVFDSSARLIRRLTGRWGADGLALDGTSVFVNEQRAGTITRIDATTLAVTGSWPTLRPTNGALAFGGGRLWYPNGVSGYVGISSLDPGTGAVIDTPSSWYQPRFRPVEGRTDQVFGYPTDGITLEGFILDVSSPVGVTVVAAEGAGMGSAVSGPLGRLWTPDGFERSLSTLAPTGLKYPSDSYGPAGFSSARGGLLALGSLVSRLGTPVPTHQIPQGADPSSGGVLMSVFGAGGNSVLYATTSRLVAWSLAPTLVSTSPEVVYTDLDELEVKGTGIGRPTSVTVDGGQVGFRVSDPSTLEIDLPPGTSAGRHEVIVQTAWGTSNSLAFLAQDRPAPPVVQSFTPASVPIGGGAVTIRGTGFTGATSVSFSGLPPTLFAVIDDGTIEARAQGRPAGGGTVSIVTPGGTNATSPQLDWIVPPAVVASVSPTIGYRANDVLLTIKGTGFYNVVSVAIGGTSVPEFTVADQETIRAVLRGRPDAPLGPQPIVVTTSVTGASAPSPAVFTSIDQPNPAVDSVDPSSGPATGGTIVTVKGTSFFGATAVKFGLKSALSFTVIDDQTLLASAPPGAAGSTTVSVDGPGGRGVMGGLFLRLGVVPPPPSAVTAVAADEEVMVSWIPPDTDGGFPLLGYTAESNPGGKTCQPVGSATSCVIRGLTNGVGYRFTVRATNFVGTGLPSSPSALVTPKSPTATLFTPLSPKRILDSRAQFQVGPYATPWGAGTSREVQVAGVGGVPADAESVVLNVTVTATTASSWLNIWPAGESKPPASSLNWQPGWTVPNAVTVKVGEGGKVRIANAQGSTHVVVDVVGYYRPDAGKGFTSLAPARILDSRAEFQVGPYTTPWGAGTSREVQVTGVGGVPAGADAVVVNMTVTETSAPSFLNVWPAGEPRTAASSLNWLPGWTIPNAVTVKVGAGGKINVANDAGSADVVVDVVGYFDEGSGLAFHSVSPARLQDSRAQFQMGPFSIPWGSPMTRNITVTDALGVPADAEAVLMNVTVTETSAPSWLSLWPAGGAVPIASNLNWAPGWTIPNAVTVKVGTAGKVSVSNAQGSTHVVADISGWYG